MVWRAIIPGVLSLVLLAAPVAIRGAFAQTDEDAASSSVGSDAQPIATPPSPTASTIQAAKPKRRMTPILPVAANVGAMPINFFGEFSLLRLFGIAAIPRS